MWTLIQGHGQGVPIQLVQKDVESRENAGLALNHRHSKLFFMFSKTRILRIEIGGRPKWCDLAHFDKAGLL